jgi:hypothetical protein
MEQLRLTVLLAIAAEQGYFPDGELGKPLRDLARRQTLKSTSYRSF